jgi:hypothetical protein
MHTHTHGIFRGGTVASPGGGKLWYRENKTRGPADAWARSRARLLCLNGWEASPGRACGAGTGPGKFPEGKEIGGMGNDG